VNAKENQKDAPSARLWCSSVIHKNKMYIAGGHTTQGQTNYIGDVKDDLYEYDFGTRKWKQLEAKLAGRT
jgi:N-acetylneuraminic acid mutarotase